MIFVTTKFGGVAGLQRVDMGVVIQHAEVFSLRSSLHYIA